ncbi:MAG: MGMT family protein [Candidatus Absconditabacterales bacterium]
MKPQIIQVINQIPFGKVCSYGSVAAQLDIQCDIQTSGWMVGKVLSSLPQHERDSCPWRRVINKQGYIAALKLGHKGLIQKQLLEAEGIAIEQGSIDMRKYAYNFAE